jgi:hypothetical protein
MNTTRMAVNQECSSFSPLEAENINGRQLRSDEIYQIAAGKWLSPWDIC